jgi:vancomycin resistance protein YoaR
MSPRWILIVRLALAVALGAGAAVVWRANGAARGGDRLMPGLRLHGADVGGEAASRVATRFAAEERRFLDTPVTLTHGRGQLTATWAELGAVPERQGLFERLPAIGRGPGLLEPLLERRRAARGRYRFQGDVRLDAEKTLAALEAYREQLSVRPVSARLDLARRTIVPGQVGYELDVHESLRRLLVALRARQSQVALAVEERHPRISAGQVKDLGIGTVLGWYETPYSLSETMKNRTYNLRVAAQKLSGTILLPGELFDFNQVLGPRNQEEGYRIAPVIARGELVDGVAGGVCQISSTLFAAAFFAGLDIVKAEVHSMPSHYIELGLDATVVWPDTTLQLRNPYDFPVVIHYQVNSGRVRAEILGRRRLYKVGFERSVVALKPFREELRQDENLLVGKRTIEQQGQRGYVVKRRRIFFDAEGHEVRTQFWGVIYPPTTMILKLGAKKPEDPDAPPPPELKPVPPVPDPVTFVRKVQ